MFVKRYINIDVFGRNKRFFFFHGKKNPNRSTIVKFKQVRQNLEFVRRLPLKSYRLNSDQLIQVQQILK